MSQLNVNVAMIKLVAADALPALMSNLLVGRRVNRGFEPTIAAAGDTVNIPIPPIVLSHSDNDGPGQRLGNCQMVLRHFEANFGIPDVTTVLAVPELLQLYMSPAVIALAETIETALLALAPQFSKNAPVGVVGNDLTEETLDLIETELFNSCVPLATSKHLALGVDQYRVVRKLARFVEEGDRPAGTFKSLNVFRSPWSEHNLAFTREAMALVTRRLPQVKADTGCIAEYAEVGNFGMRVISSLQPKSLSQHFTLDVLFGVGVLRNAHGVEVRS